MISQHSIGAEGHRLMDPAMSEYCEQISATTPLSTWLYALRNLVTDVLGESWFHNPWPSFPAAAVVCGAFTTRCVVSALMYKGRSGMLFRARKSAGTIEASNLAS
nr:hypothetical protein CFP56_03821 [Quercus suber]